MTSTGPQKRYLEERIVFCANCDANSRLQARPEGLVCVTCASPNWMYLPSGIPARLQASARAAVQGIKNAGAAMVQRAAVMSNTALRALSTSGLPVLSNTAMRVLSKSNLPVLKDEKAKPTSQSGLPIIPK